ncbi:outer membrane lipoprotein carrier protein LolA [Thermus oshimai]|jgi:outer membrane lipoprotein-sorting protein|uniref:Outer membrane lipoprotein-sorting protein n=1 Tax=Thermus oshimai JL-2 TaxID=751945 RepID=K7QYP2_THEOS|nr:outer membrane lipoprotein carrier protein LolA [Thermus oshimai]AFV77168.1 outer membrane lipoprotein-sorting protein [Thermus oshimai JL-2]
MRRTWWLLVLSALAWAQNPEAILEAVTKNLSTPWQAEVQGQIQGPSGEETLRARVYAVPQEGVYRIEFLKPGSLEGNFTVVTEKEVWNYLYLTNQLIIAPKEKAQVQNLGFSPQAFGDLKALSEKVAFTLEGEEALPEGVAWRLRGRAKERLGFQEVVLYVLKSDPRPLRFLFRDEGGKTLADLRVVNFKKTPLRAQDLKRYPKDAQVVRR